MGPLTTLLITDIANSTALWESLPEEVGVKGRAGGGCGGRVLCGAGGDGGWCGWWRRGMCGAGGECAGCVVRAAWWCDEHWRDRTVRVKGMGLPGCVCVCVCTGLCACGCVPSVCCTWACGSVMLYPLRLTV